MEFKTIVYSLLENINENKMDNAIKIAYNAIDIIKSITKEYCFNIKDKFIEIEKYNEININDNSNYIDLLNAYRFCIHKLILYYKHSTIKENDVIASKRTNISYHITIADDNIKLNLFILYLFVYYIESCTRVTKISTVDPDTLNSKPHVGIDYEFNMRMIALMQISFETYASKNFETDSFIWIINPAELNKDQQKILIKYLLTNQDIYKIFHGSDSLDIPYLYEIEFQNDKHAILSFTKKLIDTRFLCEYVRLSLNLDRKCSIYDALLYFGTITEQKHIELEEIHESMGPVQDISWNIHKMSSYHIKYSYYDVLFLKHYVMDIYKKINTETPEYIYSYKYVNPITRFAILDRREVIEVVENAKEEINIINNYLVKYKDENYTLVNIFNNLIENFKICILDDECIDFNFLLLVGFLKKSLIIILKKIVYYVIKQTHTIYQKRNEEWKGEIDLESTYKLLRKYELYDMIKLFDTFKLEAFKKIELMYP